MQLNEGLTRLQETDDDAVNWLKTMVATALANNSKFTMKPSRVVLFQH